MLLSVAIPTRNRPDCVSRLLASLSAQNRLPDEIIVVDSSTDRRTQQSVERANGNLLGRIRFFTNEPGLTRQRNRAISEATGDVLVFLDDDVELDPGFIAALEAAFDGHPDVAGIGGFIVNEWGKEPERWWKLRKRLGLLPGAYEEGRLLPYGICLPLSTLKPFSGIKIVGWLPGGATAWRRWVFERY